MQCPSLVFNFIMCVKLNVSKLLYGFRFQFKFTLVLKLFRFDAFPSYYIGEMEKAFHGRKMSNSLQDANHELWKTIQQAKLVLVEEESLDSFFMDEKIIHLIPPPLWHKQTKEWPQAIVRKLYKSGELPAYFEDLTVSK